jgi:steroid Delta-isomerase
MPTPAEMTSAVHAYVKAFDRADPALATSLFADDATVEDPVGTPVKVGIAAIREFYAASMLTGAKLHLQGPVRVTDNNQAAFAFQVRLHMNDTDMTVDVIDIFRFDDNGKVAEMRAYFGPTNITGF